VWGQRRKQERDGLVLSATIRGTTVEVRKKVIEKTIADGPGASWTHSKVRLPQLLFGLQ